MTGRGGARLALGTLAAAVGAAAVVLPAPAHAGQATITIGIRGAGYVTVVEGSIEDGGSTTCDQTHNLDHRVTLSCPRIRNEEAFEAWTWLRPTTAHSPSGWEFVEWEGCDLTRVTAGVRECGLGSAAFGTSSKYPVAVFRDTDPPSIVHLSASQLTTTQGGFDFNWGSVGAVRQECRVDDGAWATCTPGHQVTLGEGRHSFQVRAEDASGNLGAVASKAVTSVDTISYLRPPALTNSSSAEFWFGTTAGTSYDCSLDGVSVACTDDGWVRLDHLAEGYHRFSVAARDGEWVDSVPYRWSWTVDATAPDTTVSGGPANGAVVPSTSATLTLGATEPGAGLSCTLDGVARPCAPGPHALTGLKPGTHTFSATARDQAGNVDRTPASRHWTVPVPSRSLTKSGGWVTRTASRAYDGRVLLATRSGSTLSYPVRNARRLALVASGGTADGTVRVYAGSRLLRTISLRTASSVTKRVIPVTTFTSAWSGKVRIVVTSSRKPVRIEGLAASTR